MGLSFDSELAKDYWFGRDEPWSAARVVRFRFPKLAYLYVMSAVVQIGVPLFVMLIGGAAFRGDIGRGDYFPSYVVYGWGGITLFSIVLANAVAFWEWQKIERGQKKF